MKFIYFLKVTPKKCDTNNTATIYSRLATVHNLFSQLGLPLTIVRTLVNKFIRRMSKL